MCLPSDFLPSPAEDAATLADSAMTRAVAALGRRRGPEEIARHETAIQALHAEGLTDAASAERLGVPVHSVAYLRRKLGLLPHRDPGDRSAVTYGPDEVAAIVRLREEECLTWTEVTRRLGRGSPSSVEGVYDRVVQGTGRAPTARDQARTRTCLACAKPFRSEWAGNRRCEPCSQLLCGAVGGTGCTLATRSALGEGGSWRQAVRGQS